MTEKLARGCARDTASLFDPPDPLSLVGQMLCLVPISVARRAGLLDRLAGRDRLYHGLHHLAVLWTLHRWLSPQQPFLARFEAHIASAIAFHDAVYDPREAALNERRSALLWEFSSPPWSEIKTWVYRAIEATIDHFAPNPLSGEEAAAIDWFVGLDLASLAAPPAIFDLNNALIRLEYRHLDDAEFRAGQRHFLQGTLARPVIYRDPVLHDAFEAAARDNIRRHLDRIA